MEEVKRRGGDKTKGSVLIDVLVAMIIVSVSLTVIFAGISMIGKQSLVNRDRVLQMIELRNSQETGKKSEFSYEKE